MPPKLRRQHQNQKQNLIVTQTELSFKADISPNSMYTQSCQTDESITLQTTLASKPKNKKNKKTKPKIQNNVFFDEAEQAMDHAPSG